MQLEELGLVGNCQFAALIHSGGDVVWCCLPRFDSEPAFGQLLDPDGGRFGISAADGTAGRQAYIDNTNVLETTVEAPGGTVRITDFAPRYEHHGRIYRPTQLIASSSPPADRRKSGSRANRCWAGRKIDRKSPVARSTFSLAAMAPTFD